MQFISAGKILQPADLVSLIPAWIKFGSDKFGTVRCCNYLLASRWAQVFCMLTRHDTLRVKGTGGENKKGPKDSMQDLNR